MVKVQNAHPKYASYTVSEEPLAEFLDDTLAIFLEQNICIGVNWSGARLVGYDIEPAELRRNIGYWVGKFSAES